jgi:AcrR family transcriptional regulator
VTKAQETGSREDLRSEIVAEATRLLREKGADAVTTRAVAQAAGVQAPTIYRLFGDKDGLVDAVAEHVMASYVASKAEDPASSTTDPVADLRAAWARHVEFGLANPELFALMGAPGRSARSPATLAGIAVLRGRIGRLAAAGLLRVEEPLALTMVHAAGTGTVLALLGTPEPERDPALADAMLDAVLGHVLAQAPAVPETTTRAVAVTFAAAVPDLPGLSDAERSVLAEWLDRSLAALRPSS